MYHKRFPRGEIPRFRPFAHKIYIGSMREKIRRIFQIKHDQPIGRPHNKEDQPRLFRFSIPKFGAIRLALAGKINPSTA